MCGFGGNCRWECYFVGLGSWTSRISNSSRDYQGVSLPCGAGGQISNRGANGDGLFYLGRALSFSKYRQKLVNIP